MLSECVTNYLNLKSEKKQYSISLADIKPREITSYECAGDILEETMVPRKLYLGNKKVKNCYFSVKSNDRT